MIRVIRPVLLQEAEYKTRPIGGYSRNVKRLADRRTPSRWALRGAGEFRVGIRRSAAPSDSRKTRRRRQTRAGMGVLARFRRQLAGGVFCRRAEAGFRSEIRRTCAAAQDR